MTSNLPAWTALDAGALPLPSGAPGGPGRVVAVLATDGAFDAGWAGTCGVGLARAWASAGHRVVLADLNLSEPTLHQEVDLPNAEGLSDVLLWGASVRRVAQGIGSDGFYMVTAGTAVADPATALESPRWGPLCDGFREAGVTLAVFLPQASPARDAVLARSSEVVIIAPEEEQLNDLADGLSVSVVGVVGVRADAEASAPELPVTEEAAATKDAGGEEPEADEIPAAKEPAEPAADEAAAAEAMPAEGPAVDEAAAAEVVPAEEPAAEETDADVTAVPGEPPVEEMDLQEPSPEEPEAWSLEDLAPEAEASPVDASDAPQDLPEPGPEFTGLAAEADVEPEAASPEEEVSGWGSLDVFEGTIQPEPEVPEATEESGAEAPDAAEVAEVAEVAEAAEGPGAPEPEGSDTEELAPAAEPADVTAEGPGVPEVPAAADEDAEILDPLAHVDPLPAFTPHEGAELDTEPRRVPPLEEVLEDAGTPATRPAGRRNVLLVVLLVLVVVVAVVGAALLGYLHIPGVPALWGAPVSSGQVSEAVPAPAPVVRTAAAEPTEVTRPAMFDVALGAYRDAAVAARRVSSLTAKVSAVVFVSEPVRVDGVLWHRVLGGPAADSTAAAALAGRIADATGSDPSRWVIRATPRAFLMGQMDQRAAADKRAAELRGQNVPAYVLAVDYSDGSTRYRVYAGAFADQNEASSLSTLLEKRGLGGATLSDRIGRLPE